MISRWCAAALLAAACTTAPAGGDLDTSVYAPCPEQPPPPSLPDVGGLTLPDEATVFSIYEVGPLTQAEGVVPLSPIQVRRYYEDRADLELLAVEDERIEAEILVTDGTHRMFVKVQISCAVGSNFTATVGSEADAAAVPTPAGTPSSRVARPPAPVPPPAAPASGTW